MRARALGRLSLLWCVMIKTQPLGKYTFWVPFLTNCAFVIAISTEVLFEIWPASRLNSGMNICLGFSPNKPRSSCALSCPQTACSSGNRHGQANPLISSKKWLYAHKHSRRPALREAEACALAYTGACGVRHRQRSSSKTEI